METIILPGRYFEEFDIGEEFITPSRTVTEADIINFAGISGDFNPIHINAEYAKTTQFGKRVVHGIISVSLISACLGTKLFGPGILYVSQTVNFKKPVFIGDTLTAICTVTEKFTKKEGKLKFIKVDTKVYNQVEDVVTEGEGLILTI